MEPTIGFRYCESPVPGIPWSEVQRERKARKIAAHNAWLLEDLGYIPAKCRGARTQPRSGVAKRNEMKSWASRVVGAWFASDHDTMQVLVSEAVREGYAVLA